MGDPEVFGYFSIHYICQIKDAHTGPRYDWLKGISFEIQLRTLCMHAWSVVSHYLDYKGDWDVPQELRRSLSALSGLFWVADSQFESVYKERDQSIISAQQGAKSGSLLDDVINLDTLTAFLGEKYPDRDLSGDTVSALVSELKEAGFNTLGELDAVLDKSRDAFEHYEFTNPPTGDGRFAAVGVVRISLTIASEGYRRVRERLFPGSTNREPYAAARAMLKSDT